MKVARTWTEFFAGLVVRDALELLLGALWIVASLVATFVFGFDGLWSTVVCGFVAVVAAIIFDNEVVPHPPGADGEWTKPARPELRRRNNVTGALLAVTVLAILAAFFYKFFVK